MSIAIFAGAGVGLAQIHDAPPAPAEPAAAAAEATAEGTAAATVWDGIFTAAQAERGWEPYNAECNTCHGATLRGTPGAPRIVGSAFRNKWEGESVAAFIEWLTANMPAGRGGTLSAQAYADLTALIFQENGYPAGEAEIVPGDESLQTIVFAPAPAE